MEGSLSRVPEEPAMDNNAAVFFAIADSQDEQNNSTASGFDAAVFCVFSTTGLAAL